MSVQRITIRVPEETARRIKRVAGGRSVSAWVAALVEERLGDEELERLWLAFYESVSPSRQDIRRADGVFKKLTRPRRKSAA